MSRLEINNAHSSPTKHSHVKAVNQIHPEITTEYQLAHLEIVRTRNVLNRQTTGELLASLRPVGQLARRSPGFTWSLPHDEGLRAARELFDDHSIMLLSMWETFDDLWYFTDATRHLEAAKWQRDEVTRPGIEAMTALWWIPAGQQPSVMEAKQRLILLRRLGPTSEAFSFRRRFPAP